MPDVISVNVQTGKVIERDFTELEKAEIAAAAEANAEAVAQQEAEEAKAAADRESGNAKLKELGLTDEEIAALTS
tara:strand:- start:32 stop:256 length:225 start_codon:yes stop_codon:yes gene_type:complete